jgi:hypothetical protein
MRAVAERSTQRANQSSKPVGRASFRPSARARVEALSIGSVMTSTISAERLKSSAVAFALSQ